MRMHVRAPSCLEAVRMRNSATPAGIATAEETLSIPPSIEALVIQCTTIPTGHVPIPPNRLLTPSDYLDALDALKHLALRHAGKHGYQLVGHQECGIDLGSLLEHRQFALTHWGVSPLEREPALRTRRDIDPARPRVLTCLYFEPRKNNKPALTRHDLAIIKTTLVHPWGHAQIVGGDHVQVVRLILDDMHDGAPLHIVHLR